MQMRLSSHGFLGFAAMTAATVRDSLALAVQFAATRTTALGLATYVEGDTASLVIEERAPLGSLREFAVLSLMVGLWQIGNELTGRTLVGAAEVAFPEPPWIARLPVGRPGGLVRFDQPAHRLVFPASELDVPLRTADPIALQLARAQCERELAALVDAGFPGRVRAALGRPGPGFPPLGEVARQLGVSTRTLKRKLAGHATSFIAILDDVRRHRALLLLDNRELVGRRGRDPAGLHRGPELHPRLQAVDRQDAGRLPRAVIGQRITDRRQRDRGERRRVGLGTGHVDVRGGVEDPGVAPGAVGLVQRRGDLGALRVARGGPARAGSPWCCTSASRRTRRSWSSVGCTRADSYDDLLGRRAGVVGEGVGRLGERRRHAARLAVGAVEKRHAVGVELGVVGEARYESWKPSSETTPGTRRVVPGWA